MTRDRVYPCVVLRSSEIHAVARGHGFRLSGAQEAVIVRAFCETIGLDLEDWEATLARVIREAYGSDESENDE